MVSSSLSRRALLAVVPLLVVGNSGCTFLSQVVLTMQDRNVPAKFKGLEGKKVAVVCLDADSLGAPNGEAEMLAQAVSKTLAFKVKDIQMISQSKVSDWIDNQPQGVVDYREIGRGVKAEMVVAIDMKGFSIHEGATLLKGRTNLAVKVFDLSKPDEPVYESPETPMAFPENGARHVTENEANFRTLFIHTIAQRVCRDFYAYDKMDDFNSDAKFIGD